MNIPNPAQVASARTARLVREASTPVYSTTTAPREHLYVIEWEADTGGRFWSQPMTEAQAEAEMKEADAFGMYGVSDYDHAAKCWCQ